MPVAKRALGLSTLGCIAICLGSFSWIASPGEALAVPFMSLLWLAGGGLGVWGIVSAVRGQMRGTGWAAIVCLVLIAAGSMVWAWRAPDPYDDSHIRHSAGNPNSG